MAVTLKKTNKVLPVGRAIKISIAASFFLLCFKGGAGMATHSLALLASALYSFTNMTASWAHWIAVRKADAFLEDGASGGHDKLESFAGFIQGIVVGLLGLFMAYESVVRLTVGSAVRHVAAGIYGMFFAVLATGYLVRWLKKVAKQYSSIILSAEGLRFATDVLFGIAVIVSLALVRLTHYVFWDLVVSAAISIYIIKTAYEVLVRSVDELLDRSLSPDLQRQIKKLIVLHDPAVAGIHRFRSRKSAGRIVLDFYISIEGADDFKRAQGITESLAAKIQKKYPEVDVLIGFDALGEDGRVEHASAVGRG